MPLTALAFLVIYVVGLCAALFNPAAGAVLYVLVYHVNPNTQWWGPAVQGLGPRLSFTVALATGLGILIRRPRLEYGARQFPLAYVLALVLALLAVGSLFWGVDITPRGQYQAEKILKLMIWIFILLRCVRTPAEYHALIYAWLVGVLYLGYEAEGGAGIFRQGRLTAGLGGPDFDESSDLAVHLVATLPLVGAAFFMARTWLGKAFTLLTGALAVNMLIMTRTRNALAGLALVAGSCVLSLPRRYRLKGLAAIAAGSYLALQLTDPGWWKRMATIAEYHSDAAATGRIQYWKAALKMVRDHPFGIGLGNFHHVVMDYIPELDMERGAHNTIMACLAELGWPGLAVFLLFLAVVLHRLGRVRVAARHLPDMLELRYYRWRTNFHLGWHTVALRSAILGYLGCSMFTTRLFSEDFWLLLGLSMCLDNASKYAAALAAEPDGVPAEPQALTEGSQPLPAPVADLPPAADPAVPTQP